MLPCFNLDQENLPVTVYKEIFVITNSQSGFLCGGIFLWISRLHEVLMDLQNQQLKQLSDWLDMTEARIKRMGAQPLGPELDDIKRQIEEQKVCLVL